MSRALLLICLALVGCQAEPAAVPPASPPTADAPATPPTAVSAESVATPSRPQPTAAQIAEWERYNARPTQPLELVACYDDFGDAFVQCAAVSPDGKQFALGGAKLTLWNSTDAKPIANLIESLKEDKDIERPIRAVAFSPNGDLLVAGDQRGMLRVWNPADQRELFAIRAHGGRLTKLAVSPDSKNIATTSYSGEVLLWNAADGAKLKSFQADVQEVHALVFLTEKLLATAGRDATVWNVDSGEQVATLNTGRLLGPALALSADGKLLAFADADGKVKFWDVEKRAAADFSLQGGAQRIAFSADGKWIATYADRTIRIFNAATQNLIQVIDADGDRTTGLQWLPGGDAFLVASENGLARLWGPPDFAANSAARVKPLPKTEIKVDDTISYSSHEFSKIIDVRSFPRLPGALRQFGGDGFETYDTPATQADAELFHRWACDKAGWTEVVRPDPTSPGLNFLKFGCHLNIALSPASSPSPGREGDLQVSLRFTGNVDVRKLPTVDPIRFRPGFASQAHTRYRTKTTLTEVEVKLLLELWRAGWSPYSRLGASGVEDPRSRHLSLLQRGSILTVFLSHPEDAADEVAVQMTVHTTNKSLPLLGRNWIEFDNSTDLQLLATSNGEPMTGMIEYYDTFLPYNGWQRRETGRIIDEEKEKAWLPYFRGQQDVLIRLSPLPPITRIAVGDAERTSWQLAKPPAPADPDKTPAGIEAADFKLPRGAAAVKFDVDQKRIDFELINSSPPKLVEWFVKQMESLDWKRDGVGVLSDEYSLVTFKQGKAEVQLRARAEKGKGTGSISGDGLLWTKPLPSAPVRISYETWMRRNRKPASLGYLDEFLKEMQRIPADAGR